MTRSLCEGSSTIIKRHKVGVHQSSIAAGKFGTEACVDKLLDQPPRCGKPIDGSRATVRPANTRFGRSAAVTVLFIIVLIMAMKELQAQSAFPRVKCKKHT